MMNDLSGLVVFKNAANGEHGFAPADHEAALENGPVDYLRARERAERAAAKRAQSLAARQVHQELAQQYAQLLRRSA